MKRLFPTILSLAVVVTCLAPVAVADDTVSTSVDAAAVVELGEPVAETAIATQADASFDQVRTPIPALIDLTTSWGGVCIEPSPCSTHADCGVTREGFPGVCLPNFNYPQVPSPKVCLCP